MSAAVYLREKNSASETPTVVCYRNDVAGRLRFKTIDHPNPYDDNGEIIKPGSVVRSMEKWLRLYIGATGPAGSISSPKLYMDGADSFGPGVTLYIRTTNPGSFSTPGTPANDSAGTDIFTYTSGSPKALDVANAGPYSTTNADFGDYIVLWLTVDSAIVAPGKVFEKALPLESMKIIWTET